MTGTIPFRGLPQDPPEVREPTNEEIAMALARLERIEAAMRVQHARQIFDSLANGRIMEGAMTTMVSVAPLPDGVKRPKAPKPIDWDQTAGEAMAAADAWGRQLDKRHQSKATVEHARSLVSAILRNLALMGADPTTEQITEMIGNATMVPD